MPWRASVTAHKDARARLWHVPSKSPDLNPVEKFWAWVRKALHRKDLEDLMKKRAVPGRMAYKERVRRLSRSPKAEQVAKNIYRGFRKTALDVKNRWGQASSHG